MACLPSVQLSLAAQRGSGCPFTGRTTPPAHCGPSTTGRNYDGRVPAAALILSQSTLFGTASGGGNSGIGTVFRLNTDGTGFTNLHNFSGSLITNTDGGSPLAALILSNNTLYGTTSWGGTSGSGTVFRVNTDGSGFTTMHNFANNDGANPEAALILSGNTLVGTTKSGGSAGNGTLFTIRLDGTFFTTVHQFSRLYGLLIPLMVLFLTMREPIQTE